VANQPDGGFTAVCSWEKFCSFAREPETKKVERDSTIVMGEGVRYEVSPELVGERVIAWWGLFDNEIYVEFDEKRYGPYKPAGGATPLLTYRRHKKTRREKNIEKIDELAESISISREVLSGKPEDAVVTNLFKPPIPSKTFVDRFEQEVPNFENTTMAKLAISDYLGRRIADLPDDAKMFIEDLRSWLGLATIIEPSPISSTSPCLWHANS
jgi:hypothetical protein